MWACPVRDTPANDTLVSSCKKVGIETYKITDVETGDEREMIWKFIAKKSNYKYKHELKFSSITKCWKI